MDRQAAQIAVDGVTGTTGADAVRPTGHADIRDQACVLVEAVAGCDGTIIGGMR